jgi:transcriptional regulator with XRE-family HTH domain
MSPSALARQRILQVCEEDRMAHRLDALAAQRASAGKSLEQLANASGVHAAFLSRAEAGNPLDVSHTTPIAAALGVTLTTLGKADVHGG